MQLLRALKYRVTPRSYIALHRWEILGTALVNLLVFGLLFVYLFPTLYMFSASFMETAQLRDRNAPPYPARQIRFEYEGDDHLVYKVPFGEEIRELALVNPGRTSSEFVDPADPEAGLIPWDGSWRTLVGVYEFHATLDNFTTIFRSLRIGEMLQNTLLMALISGIGVTVSSIIVAYGFARFRLPGGNLLFYLMIATLLIPENITLIPTYFIYVRVLDWNGTWLPILLPFFFGNAVYIFLLRQNFKSIPRELEEAAVIDGAGPLRTLFSVVLPQSWPVVITITLLHFFYIWNETRQASLYLAINRTLAPISFGVQNYQSLFPNQNELQASALIVIVVPVVILLIAQRYFMRDVLVTGTEK
jgi:multiple sugar transport system permease protein